MEPSDAVAVTRIAAVSWYMTRTDYDDDGEHHPIEDRPHVDRRRLVASAVRYAGGAVGAHLSIEFDPSRPEEELVEEVCDWISQQQADAYLVDTYWPVDLPCLAALEQPTVDASGFFPHQSDLAYPGRPELQAIQASLQEEIGNNAAVVYVDSEIGERFARGVLGSAGVPPDEIAERSFGIAYHDRFAAVEAALDDSRAVDDLVLLVPPALASSWLSEHRPDYRVHVMSSPEGGPWIAWQSASDDPRTLPNGEETGSHYRPNFTGIGWLPSLDAKDPTRSYYQSPQADRCLSLAESEGARYTRHPTSIDATLLYCEAAATAVRLVTDEPAKSIYGDMPVGSPIGLGRISVDEACDCLVSMAPSPNE